MLELIISMTILLSFLVVITLTLMKGQRFVQETQGYAFPQKEATILLRKFREELTNSFRKFIVIGEQGASIRFLSMENPSHQVRRIEFHSITGAPIWKKWVSFAWNSENREVSRHEVPLDSPTHLLFNEPPPNMLPSEFPAHPQCRSRVLARGVSDLEILRIGNGQYQIRTQVERQVSVSSSRTTGERVRVNMEATVVILNDDD